MFYVAASLEECLVKWVAPAECILNLFIFVFVLYRKIIYFSFHLRLILPIQSDQDVKKLPSTTQAG